MVNNLQESLDVEVKNWLNGLREKNDKAKLVKEIVALANNSGGRIFIGFEDQGDVILPEIEPAAGELEAFTQDAITEIVQCYVSPPCQCRVKMVMTTRCCNMDSCLRGNDGMGQDWPAATTGHSRVSLSPLPISRETSQTHQSGQGHSSLNLLIHNSV
ncbi:MAG: ATP-binding protein [Cyanobacteria bacterium MAG IRC4_bin_6]|nr:ATP-binding protein [Cyanobacteria bacterium MAG IRC4_bin_6]